MLVHYRSACIAHISGRATTRIPGRSYATSFPHISQEATEKLIKTDRSSGGAQAEARGGVTDGGSEPKSTVQCSTASLSIAEAKARAAALTQARVAKAKARAKAKSTTPSYSTGASSSNRAHRSNIPYNRRIWPGAPKNTAFMRTIVPSVEPNLISTEREDVSNTPTITTKKRTKKTQKDGVVPQRVTGKWNLVVKDDVPTDPSSPSLPLSSPPLPPQSPTRRAEANSKPCLESLTGSNLVAPFSPIWLPSLPSTTPSTKVPSLPSAPSSAKTTENNLSSTSLSSNTTPKPALADVVESPKSASIPISDTVSSTASSTASPAARSTQSRNTLTKAEEYERLWEAEFRNQRSFAIRNPSGIARSTLETTSPSFSSSSTLSFPPLSEVLSSPSPAHNIFPRLVSSAPGRSSFQVSPTPSVLANEIPSVELIDILVPPSDFPKNTQPVYNRSNPPQIPRKLPKAFRHPAFESFLSRYAQVTSISPSSSVRSETPSATAFEREEEGEADSIYASDDRSTDSQAVVPFNVADPNWSPSVTQVALLRAATFKKDTFDAVRKPVLSVEGGPISRSKRRARYIARKEDERMRKEIQAKVERERLAREEKGLGWSERIKRRLEERERRDAETNPVLSSLSSSFLPPPPSFQPPPARPAQPSAPSGLSNTLSSSSSSSNDRY